MTQMTQEQILAQANAIAEIDDDMTEVQAGGGGGRRLPVGWSVARFTSYTETGKHIELYQGKAKDPALQFRLGFELFSPNYLNEDGTPYFIEMFDMSRSRNEKARAFKLFKAMNYKGLAKVFPQLLNEVFLVEIKDYLSKTAKPGTEPRSIIGEVTPGIDRLSGQPYACPEATKLFLFSWALPTLEGWDALYIDGTNDDGKSKNWKQEKIAGATDFAGSALETLLLSNGRAIPAGTPQKTGAAPAGAQPAGAAPAAAPVYPPQPVAQAVVAAPAAAPAAPQVAPAVTQAAPAVPAVAVTPSPVAPTVPSVPAAPAVNVPATPGNV